MRAGPSPARQAVTSMLIRVTADTGNQVFQPFLGAIAPALGLDAVALGRLVGLRSAAGASAPLWGALSDRLGHLNLARCGIAAIAVGLLGLAWLPGAAAACMLVMGVGLAITTPALQAHLSDNLPYASRGRWLGVVEYSWALAGIAGLAGAGLIAQWLGWRALFVLLGALSLASLATTSLLGRSQARARHESAPRGWALSPSAWAGIAHVGLIFYAVSHLMFTLSQWLGPAYALGTAEIGLVALALGLADLCGSTTASLLSDRLGKRRIVLTASLACLTAFLVLPGASSLAAVLFSLMAVRGSMQLAYVANIPLLSEQEPSRRGLVLSLASCAGFLGVALASLTGPQMFAANGSTPTTWPAVAALCLTIAGTLALVREPRHATRPLGERA